jgi:hypothetical protein
MSVRDVKLDDEEYQVICFDKKNIAILERKLFHPFRDFIHLYYNKNDFLRKVRESTNKSIRIILPYYLLTPNEQDHLRELEELIIELNGMDQVHSIYLYYYGTFDDSTEWKRKYKKIIDIKIITTDLHEEINRICSSIFDDLDKYYDNKKQICERNGDLSLVDFYDVKQRAISEIHKQYIQERLTASRKITEDLQHRVESKKRKLADLEQQGDMRSNRPSIDVKDLH